MKRAAWSEIVLGVLMIGLGVYTLINPDTALVAIVVAYAVLAILSGIEDFVVFYALEKRGGFGSLMMILSGVLNIAVGILLFFNIGAAAWALSVLFPIWFIMRCAARLANLDSLRYAAGKFMVWVAAIINVLGIVLGAMLLFDPLAGAVSLIYFVAFYLLTVGLGCVLLGGGIAFRR